MAMPEPYYQDEHITLYHGDNRAILPHLSGVTAVATDPPYGLAFMGKEWDHGVPGVEFWQAIAGACLPGAMMLAFGGTRTYHRMVCAIEDAGWEIRDCLQWIYGSGFPKSLDVSKAIDKAAGVEREVVGHQRLTGNACVPTKEKGGTYGVNVGTVPPQDVPITAPATETARTWDGWGTALSPSHEPICLAMNPLSGTFAANALEHGVAGLNIDGARIPTNQYLTTHMPCDTLAETKGGVSWELGPKRMSIIASIAASAASLEEQGQSRDTAIGTAVQRLSEEQRSTLFDTSKTGISCFDGPWTVAPSGGADTSTSSSTATCGKKPTADLFQKDTSFTTETEIARTIASTIWNLCSEASTEHSTAPSTTQGKRPSQQGQGNSANAAPAGRWPKNCILDGSEEVLAGFPVTKTNSIGAALEKESIAKKRKQGNAYGAYEKHIFKTDRADSGTAARFFKCCPQDERCGARFELANGERVSPCRLPAGHDGNHEGTCLGSVCEWPQGCESEYDLGRDPLALPGGVAECEHSRDRTVPDAPTGEAVTGLGIEDGSHHAHFCKCCQQDDKKGEQNEMSEMWKDGDCGNRGELVVPFVPYGAEAVTRFFYCAKASRAERNRGCEGMEGVERDDHNLSSNACSRCGLRVKANGSGKKCECGDLRETVKLPPAKNNHPTVKPLALMRYLCTLVTMPERNLILDPFAGSGTTGVACKELGLPCILIEQDEHHCEIIAARCAAAQRDPLPEPDPQQELPI